MGEKIPEPWELKGIRNMKINGKVKAFLERWANNISMNDHNGWKERGGEKNLKQKKLKSEVKVKLLKNYSRLLVQIYLIMSNFSPQ